MKTGKRYGSVSLAESMACEAAFGRVEMAWQSKDVEQLVLALKGLKPNFIYSNYPWYKRWNELKPLVINALWHGLPRERFWNIECHQNIRQWDFLEALEPVAEELSESDLKQLCERCGVPTSHRHPRLWNRLVGEQGEEFSSWLMGHIETNLNHPERLKAAQNHKPKTSFRIFHWQPYKPDVATPIEILSRRRDKVAHAQTSQWLRELPFSSDRNSVQGLLRGALHTPYPELTSDFTTALEKFSAPSDLRLVLLEWFAKHNLSAALTRLFADLRAPMSETARESYIQFLEGQLPEWKSQNPPLLNHEMASVECRGWSVFMRGYWASLARQNGLALACRVNPGVQLIDKTVRFFDATHPYVWGGCIMGWPLLMLLGFVIQSSLSLIWGTPPKQWMAFNWTLTTIWATYVAVTATFDIYHGGEARRSRFKMALCSYGLLTAMLLFGIISRVL